MTWSLLLSISAVFAAPLAAGLAASAAEANDGITAAITHENLAVYFIRGTSASGPVPLTLQEALAKGAVTVHETGDVNELAIENTGADEVFVQAGDIVKGGRQDRVLTVSLLVPARSGKVPIGAYCVEQGRWSARGREDAHRFASAEKALPSREAKLALLAPAKPRPAAQERLDPRAVRQPDEAAARPAEQRQLLSRGSEGRSRQSEVWAQVAKIQRDLSDTVKQSVNSKLSASSLQLSLENERLAAAKAGYVDALIEKGLSDPGIVGFIVAIDGRISGADVYPSNGLFRKMWPKLLDAAATEAIAGMTGKPVPAPAIDDARSFLTSAEAASQAAPSGTGRGLVQQTYRESDHTLLVESRRSEGAFVHRAYVAK
ncbi:MAG: hypothetical protein KJZ80_10065 [Hyphomicrobiaceae bacterium]|nr:hypothetical protein [Hyphomicrobiaceae bacterium]